MIKIGDSDFLEVNEVLWSDMMRSVHGKVCLLAEAVMLMSAFGTECLAGDIVFAPDMTVESPGGAFSVTFGEFREILGDDFDYDTGKWVTVYGERGSQLDPNSEYYADFTRSVVRAFHTLEGTFANKASRQLQVQVVFAVDSGRTQGASADPWWQDDNGGGTRLTYGDLGVEGVSADTVARVNKIEYVWKYGMNDGGASGGYDVRITFRSPVAYSGGAFGSFYVGEDAGGYRTGQYDVETITLHEMGHALGFHTGTGFGSVSMLDLMTDARLSSRPGGGTEWLFTGETATELNGGTEVQLMPGDSGYDPHVRTPAGLLMQDGTQNPGAARGFTELDLAMFQDLGWTLMSSDGVVPEPATAMLSLLGLAGLAARRRRRM